MAEILESNLAPIPTCRRSHPSQALPSLRCSGSSAKNCSSESAPSESVRIRMKRAPRSCCHVHNVVQNSKWLFDAVRGMPTIIIPGFTLRHARTVASCASSSVKSHVPSNKATPCKGRVVPTLLISSFPRCTLDWGFRFGHISSIFLSMARRTLRGTDFVGWDSSTMQLKNPSGMLKDSVTCFPDSTFCPGTSPSVVIWLAGRCPVS